MQNRIKKIQSIVRNGETISHFEIEDRLTSSHGIENVNGNHVEKSLTFRLFQRPLSVYRFSTII